MLKDPNGKLTSAGWAVVAIAVAVLACVLWSVSKGPKSELGDAADQSVTEESVAPTPATTGGAANSTTSAYTKLVAQYGTNRIQFEALCQAVPARVTFKNNTAVMFDNRSGDARPISIGGVTYQFPGYGYKIITLRSSTLPKTLYLNCGASVNVGQILLQK